MVSKVHARLNWSDGTLTVVDLGSRNGTWLNGVRVEHAELRSGDELAFGSLGFRVELPTTPQPSHLVVAENIQESPTRDASTTTVSLAELDQLLARESKVKNVPFSTMTARPAPDTAASDCPKPTKVTSHDSVSSVLAQAPVASDDEVIQQFLAGGAAKSTEVADAARTSESRVVSTAVGLSATSESPDQRESAAASTTLADEKSQPVVEPPEWRRPRQLERQSQVSVKPKSHQTSSSSWGLRAPIPKWANSPIVLAAIAIVLLAVGWFWLGSGDGAAIQLCLHLRSQLVERRTQGKTSGPEWEKFRQQAIAELTVLAKALDQSVDASQPQRQALLYAAHNELTVMLTQDIHWKRELSADARKREELFDRHMRIAQGQVSWKEFLPSYDPGDSPDTSAK